MECQINYCSLNRVWKGGGGGPDPAFPLLFHENPKSRTFFTAIPNPVVFFPKEYVKKIISAKANRKIGCMDWPFPLIF